tara:strand:- start:308 stop:2368 length:2061 start_codon:yes stop_codon:yes gene_type:complete
MAENEDQQGQASADEEASGSTGQPTEDQLHDALQDFARNIFANRDDKEKWQAVLNGAPDDIVRLIGQFPKLLSDILSADSEQAVDDIIAKAQHSTASDAGSASTDQQVSVAGDADEQPTSSDGASTEQQSTEQQDDQQTTSEDPEDPSDPTASSSSTSKSTVTQERSNASGDTATEQQDDATTSDAAEQTKMTPGRIDESASDSAESDPGVDSAPVATEGNTSDATLTVDQTALKMAVDSPQDAEQSDSGGASSTASADQKDQAQPDGAQTGQSSATDNETCSNDVLADFLREIFEKKSDDAALEKCLQKADSAILNRLDANPFYLSRVLAMTNDNDLEDLLSILKQVDGPFYAEDANAMSQLTEEGIDYLLDSYAHIEFDCDITNQDNDKLRQLLSFASPALMTSIGVPIQCRLSKDGRVMTASVSMRGDFTGFEASTAVQVADNEVDTILPDIDGSLPMKRMQLANELVSMIQGMQLENVKMRAGRRILMRSFWALLQANNIPYSGFEPTPAEQAWYDKRAHYLSDQFAPQQALSSSAAPKMGMGGGRMTSVDNNEESAASDESPKSPVDETTKPDLARELTDKQAEPSLGAATQAPSSPDNSSSTAKEGSGQEEGTETDDGMRKKKSSASTTKSPAKKRAVKASTAKQATKKQSVDTQDTAATKAKKTPKKTKQSPTEDGDYQ